MPSPYWTVKTLSGEVVWEGRGPLPGELAGGLLRWDVPEYGLVYWKPGTGPVAVPEGEWK